MKVTINDNEVVLEEGCTVRQMLLRNGLGSSPCAVEVNRQVVPKRRHDEHVIAEGDHVEIVTLVGGG